MEEHTPGQGARTARRESLQHQPGVDPDVSLGVELWGLLHSFHLGYLGQHHLQQAGIVEQLEPAARGALGEQFGQFVAEPLGGDL